MVKEQLNNLNSEVEWMESAQTVTGQASTTTSQVTKRKPEKARPFSEYLDKSLFIVVTMMLVFTVALLSVNLVFQYQNYSAGISAALNNPNDIDHAVIVTYNRAWDFAIVKISSIFLAFCLILIGALYLLRAALISYSLSVSGHVARGSLETGSPGLVMLTLGVILMTIVILSDSKVEYYNSGSPSVILEPAAPPDEAKPPQKEASQPQILEKPGEKR